MAAANGGHSVSESKAVQQVEQKLGIYESDRLRWCQLVVKSGLAPKSLNTPEKVFIAIETGLGVGLSPLQALRSVYVVNGMPAWTGQGALALIRGAKVCSIPPIVRHVGDGDEHRCEVEFQRHDMPSPEIVSFSVADAKRAKLWGKPGPWSDYPDDMLMWRAVGKMSRAYFSDVTQGIAIVEEARDYVRGTTSVETQPPETPDPLLEIEAGEPECDPNTGEEIPDYITADTQENLL
jgi:hypothetical protein